MEEPTNTNASFAMNNSSTNDGTSVQQSTGITTSALVSTVATFCLVIISLIGNPLTACVVLRKKYRSTSTGFYILCMAVFDTMYTIFWPLEILTKVRKKHLCHKMSHTFLGIYHFMEI